MRGTFTEEEEDATPASRPSDPTRTLIDDYLAEQQRLQTPVRRFSEAHDRQAFAERTQQWRELIPLSEPAPGEQYAFEVDLDRCTGCKACVAGCHSLNGLEEEETWRDIGLVLGGTRSHPFQQTVTTACHHCADPACMHGCPVLAYDKDPHTGIVRHLDDQCIGCQYCVLKCPYDVPKYSDRLGIVRKCDMCQSRLAVGEAPACAQACPTQAIRIVNVRTKTPEGKLVERAGDFLDSAPTPDYTKPTTRFITRRAWPDNVEAADTHSLRPQPAHWPLVVMLTFTPMAVGCFVSAAALHIGGFGAPIVGVVAAFVGLVGSVFHLGQPLRAWRVFLGLRRSWLSREAVIFGGWFGLAATFALQRTVSTGWIGAIRFPGHSAIQQGLIWLQHHDHALSITTAAIGVVGLICSAMIYVDTRRPFWKASQTFPRFFGAGAALAFSSLFAMSPDFHYAIGLIAALLLKVAVETRCFRVLDEEDDSPSPERLTALVLSGPLRRWTALRYLTVAAVIIVTGAMLAMPTSPLERWAVFALALFSEGLERALFFKAVFAPKMPGVASA
jgi:Fe-S-cluster-containing dehydrogenase component/DMSO reductase anchor subunit